MIKITVFQKKIKEFCHFLDIMIRRFQMVKKILILLLPAVLIGTGLFFAVNAYITYREDYVEVYVASHNIAQRTKLEMKDLELKKVPKQYLSNDIFPDKEDILGKYVRLSCLIPKGSFFYKGFLQEEIKDLSNTLLREGEVNFDIYTSEVKANGGSLGVGMYVDLYLTVAESHDRVHSGLLMENCRITGLYDSQGKAIQSFDTDSKVAIISLAIVKEDVSYLNKALLIGTVSLIVNSTTYSVNSSSHLLQDSEVFMYLQ